MGPYRTATGIPAPTLKDILMEYTKDAYKKKREQTKELVYPKIRELLVQRARLGYSSANFDDTFLKAIRSAFNSTYRGSFDDERDAADKELIIELLKSKGLTIIHEEYDKAATVKW